MDIRIHSVYVKEGPRESSHRRTSGHDGSNIAHIGRGVQR